MVDAKALVRTGVEFWNAHDRTGFVGQLDPSIVFVDEATGHRLVGPEEVAAGFFDLWTEAYPDNELKEIRIVGEAEIVCLEAVFVGTNTGVFHGVDGDIPPTGKEVRAPFVYVAEIRGGKVTAARHYYDRLLALEQEGILTVETLFAQLPVG